MPKRIVLFVFIGVMFVMILAGIIFIKNKTKVFENPVRAIPQNASVIIKINNLSSLLKNISNENKIWLELTNTEFFRSVSPQLYYIDSLLINNPDAREILTKNPSFISIHYSGTGNNNLAYYISLPIGYSEKKINDLISGLAGSSQTISKRKYEGKDIYELTLKGKLKSFSYATTDGLIILSSSQILLEDAIRQLHLPNSLVNDKSFKKAYNTFGKNKYANIFVNHKYFSKSLSSFANHDYREKIRSFDYYADWSELDVNIGENNIILNGFSFSEDSSFNFTSLFYNQDPVKIEVDKILPSTVSSFVVLGIDDIKIFINNYNRYLNFHGKLNERKQEIQKINKAYNIDIENTFQTIFDQELCLAFTAQINKKGESYKYVIIKTKSMSQAKQKMDEILENIARVNKTSKNNYIQRYNVDNELKYDIYNFPVRNFTGKVFGELFNQFSEHYYTFIGNYIVFGNSSKSLSSFIHANVLSKTINTDPSYKEFSYNLSAKGYIVFYSNLAKSSNNFQQYLKDKLISNWGNNIEVFRKIQALGYQLNSNSGILYNSLSLQYLSDFKDKPHTIWESLLDTVIDMKPQYVINHYTKQNEIFIQDLKNNVYLINKAGRILWKINLSEQIKSEIYQVDYFKNGKLQYLFSTKNYIHLIDRNGNYVERYPVKFRSPATNGMALFDYENNKNYRILIACENRQVYAYSGDGNVISGWQFNTSESIVTKPIQHFRVEDKDFIVFGDHYNTYILDRRGDVRVKVKEIFPKSKNNNYILHNKGTIANSSILITDTTGVIYKINFDGSINKAVLDRYSPDHFFDLKDINGDGNKEYIIADEKNLYVYKQNKLKLFDVSFNENITHHPIYFHFSYSDRKLGIVTKQSNEIYLINNDGKKYEGFPLYGSSLFSIGYFEGSTSNFNLIVGNNDNFLLNYAVQ